MKNIHGQHATSTQRMRNLLELALFCLLEEKPGKLRMEIRKLLLETEEQFSPSGDEAAGAGAAPRMRELLESALAEKPASLHMELTQYKIKKFLQKEQ